MIFLLKNTLIVCILASLCMIKHSQALQCYSCLVPTSLDNCQSIETCTSLSNFCYTTRVFALGLSTYSKGCAAACVELNTGDQISGTQTTCCETDKCNSGADSLIKKSRILISIGLVLVSVFSYLFTG